MGEEKLDYSNMKMAEVARLVGVKDINPLAARGKFAQALISESNGDHARAGELLDEAVAKADH